MLSAKKNICKVFGKHLALKFLKMFSFKNFCGIFVTSQVKNIMNPFVRFFLWARSFLKYLMKILNLFPLKISIEIM